MSASASLGNPDQPRKTRRVKVGSVEIGGGSRIAVQSMCATKTQDIQATLKQVRLLEEHGADLIRIAVDSKRDVEALAEIRKETSANLVVDLQENYRLAESVAPFVQKIRYNPGHLHHHEKKVSIRDKVKFLVEIAGAHDCAIRIGVNFGSLDPELGEPGVDSRTVAIESASAHVSLMEELGFKRYVVSLKSSDPLSVVSVNKEFASKLPFVPIHLGVTEAGMLPMGEIKTRVAFEQLLAAGIGDTVRVSLTLPFDQKFQEILIAKRIVDDVANGRFRSVPEDLPAGLNIISCPSCSRVENEAFVELAQQVKEISAYAQDYDITIAVMGCRVNGPGETDHADLGLWCAPNHVNLKRRDTLLGKFSYTEILERVKSELDALIAAQTLRVG
ncbi:MAG: (E)-4-hydroxy-3-methylbut-2-enyl-diphosphate synthase [Bdellovibrionales bacterium]|nr:(E)-4-hydroxy-3-methylbut-2-enyl-diphosphate synthase [Bdellovibrionales bacterium]